MSDVVVYGPLHAPGFALVELTLFCLGALLVIGWNVAAWWRR